MSYSNSTDVKLITGWAGGTSAPYADISDADITSLIVLADAYLDSLQVSRDTNEMKLLSAYYTAYLGSLRLEANIQSYGGQAGGVSLSFKGSNSYLEAFNGILSGSIDVDTIFKKVYY